MQKLLVAGVVLVGMCLVGCGGEGASWGSDARALTAAEVTATVPGVYAERTVVVTLDKAEGQAESETVGTYYNLNRIEAVDGKLVSSSSSCRGLVQSKGIASLSISDAVTQMIPPLVGELSVAEGSAGAVIRRAETISLVSVKLEDPWNDPLPTDGKDARILDVDQDGNPGISIDIKVFGFKGKIFVIRREHNRWEASPSTNGGFAGLITDASEQQVIGANPSMFNVKMTSKPHPDASRSTVTLVRLPADLTCDEYIAKLSTIFP